MTTDLRLRPLRPEDEAEFATAHEAIAAEGFTFGLTYEPGRSWVGYLRQLDRYRRGAGLPDGLSPL